LKETVQHIMAFARRSAGGQPSHPSYQAAK
jgi:hypothetical protein